MLELKREKELNLKLREELKKVEMERIKILDRIKELQERTSNIEIEKADISIDF